jgi:hypothetical protein
VLPDGTNRKRDLDRDRTRHVLAARVTDGTEVVLDDGRHLPFAFSPDQLPAPIGSRVLVTFGELGDVVRIARDLTPIGMMLASIFTSVSASSSC